MNFTDDSIFEDEALDINLTPLIDVVFLLLIFFMVSTTFVESRGIKVDLPAASAKSAEKQIESIELSIRKDERIFIKDREISVEQLAEEFKQSAAADGGVTLILRADKDVPHGLVVKVMDIAQQNGLTKMAVATVPDS
jgi:biopolymer transport protein ExbD